MKRDHNEKEQCFFPALWKQRRVFIAETLRRFQPESVLDYGCGEASVLSFLISSSDEGCMRRVAGIDICEDVLEEAVEACQPWPSDHTIGSVSIPDDRLKEYEAIFCSEVIEHLFDKDLLPFLDVSLGFYRPRILIVTTPNCEYNVNFPDLHYGTEHSIFRHDDHKFEWTQGQFQSWCSKGAKQYGYSMEFHGIGLVNTKPDNVENGYCTQACVFIRLEDSTATETASAGEPHDLIKHFEFPYYNEQPKPDQEIIQEIHSFIEVLCRADHYANTKKEKPQKQDSFDLDEAIDWSKFDIKEKEDLFISKPIQDTNQQFTKTPLDIPIRQLWDISRVRQLCKTIEKLTSLLKKHQDSSLYTLFNDKLTVNKAFKLHD